MTPLFPNEKRKPIELIVTGKKLKLCPGFLKVNKEFFDGPALAAVEMPKRKHGSTNALERQSSPGHGGKNGLRIIVSIVGFRKRLLDDDNFAGGNKALRDAVASYLGIDDADPRIKFEYDQVRTEGVEGTAVKIDAVI